MHSLLSATPCKAKVESYMSHDAALTLTIAKKISDCSFRCSYYASVRLTFRVQWVLDICNRYAPYLTNYDRAWIIAYVRDQQHNGLGDMHDHENDGRLTTSRIVEKTLRQLSPKKMPM